MIPKAQRHLALIVEDDAPAAEGLLEIVKAAGCDATVCDNKAAALSELTSHPYCLVILDLQIKGDQDAIQGHAVHGESLLREIRAMFPDRGPSSHALPVIVVSGVAREVETAVEVMKFGATDLVRKPINSQRIVGAIETALAGAGRADHTNCRTLQSTPRLDPSAIVIEIPGTRNKSRTAVVVGGRTSWLPVSSLVVLLRLMVGHLRSSQVHKRDLGASDDPSFKAISRLRDYLGYVGVDAQQLITNDQHGNYGLARNVVIGACDTQELIRIGDHRITPLASDLAALRTT
jgi:DNA-binding response OmpR family regulator